MFCIMRMAQPVTLLHEPLDYFMAQSSFFVILRHKIIIVEQAIIRTNSHENNSINSHLSISN